MYPTLLMALLVVLIGAMTAWPCSRGHGPSGVIGAVVAALSYLALTGRV